MAKIIRFDPNRKQPEAAFPATACSHKNVVAYTASRVVQCEVCGAVLDPFDVVVELLKSSIPPGDRNRELKLYLREIKRRHEDKKQT